jgi:nitrate/TMAO reductase-like tetraheme cytochrome c subunit/cytochrome c551/c552
MKGIWRWLTRPSATLSVLALLVVGIVIGVGGWLGFNGALHATGTNEFCGTACHSHAEFIYPGYKTSAHFANSTGVMATCSDCHIPREFFPKLWTKTEAGLHDGWAEFVQRKISTQEKYEAERPRLSAAVIEHMKSRDSRECRNCHEFSPAVIAKQSPAAQAIHPKIAEMGQTCVSCHTSVGHPPPGQIKTRASQAAAAAAPAAPAAASPVAAGPEALADKLGCLACHGVNEAKMGPALKDVAGKLKAKADAAVVAARLQKGEGHPAVQGSAEDLTKVADWVLTLAPAAGAAKPAAEPAKSGDAKPAAKPASAADGQAFAEKAGCLACHAVAEKKMGPALKDEAAEWQGKGDALAAKLKSGQGHPAVAASDDELKKIVGWMLTL